MDDDNPTVILARQVARLLPKSWPMGMVVDLYDQDGNRLGHGIARGSGDACYVDKGHGLINVDYGDHPDLTSAATQGVLAVEALRLVSEKGLRWPGQMEFVWSVAKKQGKEDEGAVECPPGRAIARLFIREAGEEPEA